MGLDQRLVWIGRPSLDAVKRCHHKNLYSTNYYMNYLDEDDINNDIYKNIKDYTVPEEVYLTETNWDLIAKECGESNDARVCMMSSNKIGYGNAVNSNDYREYNIDMYSDKYKIEVLHKLYLFCSDDVYTWRKNYDIHNLFENKYGTILNCGYYPIDEDILKKIKDIDCGCDCNETENIFYNADW